MQLVARSGAAARTWGPAGGDASAIASDGEPGRSGRRRRHLEHDFVRGLAARQGDDADEEHPVRCRDRERGHVPEGERKEVDAACHAGIESVAGGTSGRRPGERHVASRHGGLVQHRGLRACGAHAKEPRGRDTRDAPHQSCFHFALPRYATTPVGAPGTPPVSTRSWSITCGMGASTRKRGPRGPRQSVQECNTADRRARLRSAGRQRGKPAWL